jgi:hypothetical protein
MFDSTKFEKALDIALQIDNLFRDPRVAERKLDENERTALSAIVDELSTQRDALSGNENLNFVPNVTSGSSISVPCKIVLSMSDGYTREYATVSKRAWGRTWEAAEINWSALGATKIEPTAQFIGLLQTAVEIAKYLDTRFPTGTPAE